jgi:hypothetical protein
MGQGSVWARQDAGIERAETETELTHTLKPLRSLLSSDRYLKRNNADAILATSYGPQNPVNHNALLITYPRR